MSTEPIPGLGTPVPAGSAEAHAQLFADLVVQHANMALVFCGAAPHPETGEPVRDLEMARMLIDRLDMLQAKTRGNLGPEETGLLRQSLAMVRMAFVEATRQPEPASPGTSTAAPAATPAATSAGSPAAGAEAAPPEGSRKKFEKKY